MSQEPKPRRLCLLGKPALFVDGVLHPFGGPRRAVALLAYTVLHRDRALSRAAVATLFWPDEDDEDARASLRRHLHRALSALPEAPPGSPWVLADKTTLRWNPAAPIEIDTAEYDRLTKSGDLRGATALYRGDYLEDFYDEWVLPERERFRERQAANLVTLVEERRRAADYPAAIAFAQELRRLDPMREDAIRTVMSLRFAAGDRSGALFEFDASARRLRDELATDPMPETLALHRAIQHDDLRAAARPAPAETPAASERRMFPFVGRDAALGTLRHAWELAARGAGTTAVVSGEAGVGKSRLIGELRALVEAQGGRVVAGGTSPLEAEPYQAFAEAIRGALPLLRFERLEPLKTAALASLVPSVRDVVPGVPDAPPIEPARDRQRLFDALESVFEQLAEKRPLLVVLEDVHWAGPATLELLQFVARRGRDRATLVVVSFREEDADGSRRLSHFLRRLDRSAEHVALGPLLAGDIAELAAAALPEADAALGARLFAASDGNALFATELLRERLAGAASEAGVPAGIAESIAPRVAALSPAAASLLETAAVIGAGFDADLIRLVCGWPFAGVFDALGELIDRSIVRESTARRGEFTFSHQLVHAAIYARVDAETRRRLHRRVATTIERTQDGRQSLSAAIARHYDVAGFADEASTRYVAAARHALDVFAYADAIAHASRALEIGTDPRTRFDACALRERAASNGGEIDVWRASCELMMVLARELGDEDAIGTAICRRIELARQLAERETQRLAIAELTAFAATATSRRWELENTLARARYEIVVGRNRAAEAIFEEAEGGIAGYDDDQQFDFWYLRAFTGTMTDRARARRDLERAGALIGTVTMREVLTLRIAAAIADREGDYVELTRIAGVILERYRELGDIEGQAVAHQNLAMTAWYRFDLDAERAHLDAALALFTRIQRPFSIAAVLLNYGAFEQHLGDFEAAETRYREAAEIGASGGHFAPVSHALANRASLETMRGNRAAAFALATEALDLARAHEHDEMAGMALEYLAAAERDLGLYEEARARFDALIDERRDSDPRGHLELLIEAIPLYIQMRDVDAALRAANDLLGGLAADRNRVTFPAAALHAIASAFAAASRDDDARRFRTEARETLEERSRLIGDERRRAGYRSLPFHRAILAVDDAETVSR